MHKRILLRTLFAVAVVTAWATAGTTSAQEQVLREINPEELVSFNRDVPIETALDILNQFAIKFENKMIIDPKERSGTIGVTVKNMHWKRALEFILRSNGLEYTEGDRYYEVRDAAPETTAEPAGRRAPARGGEEVFIDAFTREVEINAIFFEADYATLQEIGVDWSFIRNGKVRVDFSGGSTVTKEIISAQYQSSDDMYDILALFRALESLSRGEVIANPQIRVMEFEQGKIKVGRNFFLTTRDFAGNTRFTEYEAGTILTVTPQIIGEGDSLFIHLDILAERSSVQSEAVGVTKAVTQGATQVLLLDGEQTAIAGLFSNETQTVRTGIPLLKDLPWWFFGLKYLFGYNRVEVRKKELIILIQARLVPSIADRFRRRVREGGVLNEKRREFRRRLRNP
jgi:type IV pilus assembly protein PilQ